ncbi:PREDICTED: pumilio homolog 24 [Fragaria vesca subsp. vesca]|uniref:pumilio homolog 24 n=1 Tax=Fragaria vesca subsp. vesca TaxID=101020 RepID=UPI0002C37275|nr:PREDICTED: pumilio homolog 24 [Fragaria vesca subsp. vesca]
MAAKDNDTRLKKRKQVPGGTKPETHRSSDSKKPRLAGSKPTDPRKNDSSKPFKRPNPDAEKTTSLSKKELRVRAKELAEARKKKRKPYYNLEHELAHLWEKMRSRDISKEDRYKLVSEALQKMKGKIPEIASSHVSSRVLQTCVKYCSKAERDAKKKKAEGDAKMRKAEKDAVFEELKPHFLTLTRSAYGVHLVKKMLDNASKQQLAEFISSLHGHVATLLRHMVGSVVVEHAYQLGNATQKQELLVELYSTELQLFKDLVLKKEGRLVDIIAKLDLQKSSVLKHMTSVIQPILEKGIVDHSILHRVLIEYFTIAEEFSAADVIKQLSGPLLVRMIHTRDGSRVGMLCVKHGSAKERKKIIKGMKGHICKIASDQCGSMVLVSLVSVVDDTKLITKVVINELQEHLKDLVFDKDGRRPLLQLLHPNCSRYLTPYDLASLSLSIPSLSNKVEADIPSEGKETETNDPDENTKLVDGGKKDPSVRRQELLVKSGLAERLVDVCITSAGELLRSNFGKEVIYEVATGGADGILHPTLDDKLDELYEAIATLVAEPKSDDPKEEHLLENFHSSRTIRRLILDCPAFASTLWNKALKGKCELWAQGHSCRVVSAYLASSDSHVNKLAKKELQPLIDAGTLKVPEAPVAIGTKE